MSSDYYVGYAPPPRSPPVDKYHSQHPPPPPPPQPSHFYSRAPPRNLRGGNLAPHPHETYLYDEPPRAVYDDPRSSPPPRHGHVGGASAYSPPGHHTPPKQQRYQHPHGPHTPPLDFAGLDISDDRFNSAARPSKKSRAGKSAAKHNLRVNTERVEKRRQFPPGYKLPSVESAPTSPVEGDTLPSDSNAVFEENEEYLQSLPKPRPEWLDYPVPLFRPREDEDQAEDTCSQAPPYSDDESEPERSELDRSELSSDVGSTGTSAFPLERERAPYASSSIATSSTVPSSPPPELLPRERRGYHQSSAAASSPPPPPPEPAKPEPPKAEPPKTRTEYPRVNSGFKREDLRPGPPQRSFSKDSIHSIHSSGTGNLHDNIHERIHDRRQSQSSQSSQPMQPPRPPSSPQPQIPHSHTQHPQTPHPQTPHHAQPSQPFPFRDEYRFQPRHENSREELRTYTKNFQTTPPSPRSPRSPRVQQAPRKPRAKSRPPSPPRTRGRSRPPSRPSSRPASPVRRPRGPSRPPSPPPQAREKSRVRGKSRPREKSRAREKSRPAPVSRAASPEAPQAVVRHNSDAFMDHIPACPKKKLVRRGTWFQLPHVPGFNICEKCFEVHIYPTPFGEHFTAVAANGPTYCAFNTPRILKLLWPQVVRTGRFDVFQEQAMARSRISTCSQLTAGNRSGLWYVVTSMDGRCSVIACQACYEDVILASPYHPHFKQIQANVAPNAYTCHVGTTPFIEAQLSAGKLPWHAVVREIEYRIHEVLPCPGNQLVKCSGRRWWRPKDTNLPFTVCDSCYCDGIFPSPFANDFYSVVQKATDPPHFCGMGGFSLNVVWTYAIEKDDPSPWYDAVTAAFSPMCEPIGKYGGSWNVFASYPGLENAFICDRCADMFVRPLGFGDKLDRMKFLDEQRRVCVLNPDSPRAAELRIWLGEAAGWRDLDIFKEALLAGQAGGTAGWGYDSYVSRRAARRPPVNYRRVR